MEQNGEDDDAVAETGDVGLDRCTVRELIVQLAQVEDSMRCAGGRLGAPAKGLAERAEAIARELHGRKPLHPGRPRPGVHE